MRRVSTAFLVFTVTFVLSTLLTAVVIIGLQRFLHRSSRLLDTDTGAAALALAETAFYLVTGLVVAAAVTRRFLRWSNRVPRVRLGVFRLVGLVLAAAFVVTFFLTWLLGVPAVISTLDRDAISRYKEYLASPSSHALPNPEGFPSFHTNVAFPIAPGLIVSYHSYVVGPKYGVGAWHLHSWWFSEPKELYAATTWMS